ncbi:TetR/AcrR family transcriptional regulator [Dongia sp.]|uniref:TetR/AcrR family transcriptional regulator n=1 Tax=Dongia sp. TaxID=1977262 RepID=UPI0035B3FCB7
MARGLATRNRIKEAALELFVTKGIIGTSVRDIAAAAEIAEGGLYRHYASKEDLAWKLFSENYATLAKELADLAKAKSKFADRLATMIHRFARFFDEEPLLFRFLLLSQHQELPKLKSKAQSPVQVLHRFISDAQKNGEIEIANPDLVTAQILGLLLQPATFMVYGLLAPGMQRIEAETLAACLKVVSSPSPFKGRAGVGVATSAALRKSSPPPTLPLKGEEFDRVGAKRRAPSRARSAS